MIFLPDPAPLNLRLVKKMKKVTCVKRKFAGVNILTATDSVRNAVAVTSSGSATAKEDAKEATEGAVEEVEAGGNRRQEVIGPDSAEEVAARGDWGRGHRLEVGPGGLLDQPVPDGDVVAALTADTCRGDDS